MSFCSTGIVDRLDSQPDTLKSGLRMREASPVCSCFSELDVFSRHWQRRGFLRGSLMMAAVASTGMTLGCTPSPSTQPTTPAPTLTRVLLRLKPIALPDHPKLYTVNSIDIDQHLSSLFALMDAKILQDLDMAASLFEYGATMLGWNLAKFSSLNDANALDYVERWQNGVSMQRGIVTVFKKLLYASYWRDSATWSVVGFDGPVSEKWGLPSLGNAPLPVDIMTAA